LRGLAEVWLDCLMVMALHFLSPRCNAIRNGTRKSRPVLVATATGQRIGTQL